MGSFFLVGPSYYGYGVTSTVLLLVFLLAGRFGFVMSPFGYLHSSSMV